MIEAVLAVAKDNAWLLVVFAVALLPWRIR